MEPSEPSSPDAIGERLLSEAELALIAEGMALAKQCGAYVDKLRAHDTLVRTSFDGTVEPSIHLDQRWVGMGEICVQFGFMALKRAVEQPEQF